MTDRPDADDAPPVRACDDCGKPCTYPLGCAGYCLRCLVERQHHNPGLYGRPTTKRAAP